MKTFITIVFLGTLSLWAILSFISVVAWLFDSSPTNLKTVWEISSGWLLSCLILQVLFGTKIKFR